MSKKDYYVIEKNVEKLIREGYTNFLDYCLVRKVKSKIKGLKYKEYYPYNESEKVIIYKDKKPKVRFIEILCLEKLKHSGIMGSLYGINIDMDLVGDIVIYDNHYYFMVMDKAFDFILNEFNLVGNKNISLKEVSNRVLDNYVRAYDLKEVIVPSIRIDNVVSKLTNISRDRLKDKFLNDEIIINYEVCHKGSFLLKEGDIFSIRKYGKYRFDSVLKNTKKDNYIVRIYKYVDN